MAKFSVYYDPEGLEQLDEMSPFNLKKDLKGIEKSEIYRIAEEIGNGIYNGVDRPPVFTVLYWGNSRKAASVKIRVLDVARNAGKSNGYRCIVLVDYINNCAFLLHVYRHGHGESENISQVKQNKLKKLVDDYVASLKTQT